MNRNDDFFVEIDCQQLNHVGEMCCGDVFLSNRIKEEGRTIVVLSDGMGSGVKANVLATLTASMAVNFAEAHKDIVSVAEIIMNTLPVCSVRDVSYSTFTIVDIEYDGEVRIIEYDNPQCVIMRGKDFFDPGWQNTVLQSEKNHGKILRSCRFDSRKEDRIFFWSDGVMQSGMGSKGFPFGWGEKSVNEFVKDIVETDPIISARKIARKVVAKAQFNDGGKSKDDTSCCVVYFREPRNLLVITGPPFDEENDSVMSQQVAEFEGKKIICGGSTTEILARELKRKMKPGMKITDPDLPPVSYMEGIDLVTEGILTLGKVTKLLDEYHSNYNLGMGPADQIVKMILKSDRIKLLVGTKINIAHQDPNLPVELEIRRTVVKRIVHLLENKFLKDVDIEFI